MTKNILKNETNWWCAECGWVWKRDSSEDCPNCKSDQVFLDEELWCPICKIGQYGPSQQNAGGDSYNPGDSCPSQKCQPFEGRKLVIKLPRKLSYRPKRQKN